MVHWFCVNNTFGDHGLSQPVGLGKLRKPVWCASGFQIPVNMICAEDVTYGKPHPAPFLLMLKTYLDAGNCMLRLKILQQVKSAKDAVWCFTVAILTSHEKEDLLLADLIVDGFSDLTLKQRNNQYELCW